MANSSNKRPVFSGETALPNKAASKSANPTGGAVGLVFYAMEHLGKLNIRGSNSLKTAIKAATGCDFPPLANHFETAGERHIVWLGPDEYLLLCESGKEKALHDTLTSTIKTSHFAITDVSDSLCALSLSGAAVRDVLAKGCSLDLHPSNFVNGILAPDLCLRHLSDRPSSSICGIFQIALRAPSAASFRPSIDLYPRHLSDRFWRCLRNLLVHPLKFICGILQIAPRALSSESSPLELYMRHL